MSGTLDEKDKYHWRDFVKPLVHAYNCTRNDTTGYSPYELMFGRQPRLPIDLVLGLHPDASDHKTHSEYVKGLRQRLQESYSLAAKNSRKMGEKNKARFDKKVRAAELLEGDRVLVRNVNIRGKHKLADRWEQRVHVVVSRIGDSPVYVVKPETGEGPRRTLHRDLLLPCGFLSANESQEVSSHSEATTKMTLRRKPAEGAQGDANDQEDELESDEDDLYPRSQVPEIITRGPFIYRAGDSIEPQSIKNGLNPDTPAFVPQSSADACTEPGHKLQSEVPLASSDRRSAVTQPVLKGRASDHVFIDMPEPNVTHAAPIADSTGHVMADPEITVTGDVASGDVDPEPFGLRRSTRDRRQPRKLTYDELGEPLIMAISSFFQTLGVAFSNANLLHMHTDMHRHACGDACDLEGESVTMVILIISFFKMFSNFPLS